MKEINGYLLVDTCGIFKDFRIGKTAITKKKLYANGGYDGHSWELPEGKWEIIGLAKDLTEEQWEDIVEHRYEYGNSRSKGVLITKDYVGGKALKTFTESGHSLLKANNLNPNTTLILKNENR